MVDLVSCGKNTDLLFNSLLLLLPVPPPPPPAEYECVSPMGDCSIAACIVSVASFVVTADLFAKGKKEGEGEKKNNNDDKKNKKWLKKEEEKKKKKKGDFAKNRACLCVNNSASSLALRKFWAGCLLALLVDGYELSSS